MEWAYYMVGLIPPWNAASPVGRADIPEGDNGMELPKAYSI
jgi:hypothetical protein